MPQVFRPPRLLLLKLVFVAIAMVAFCAIAAPFWRRAHRPGVADAIQQPIAFSHKHHAGDDGIDCRYCHALVETGRHAGMPDTQTCMSCHSQLFTQAEVLSLLRESDRTGKRLRWKRVHDLPDFVYFDHSVHVTSGVQCVECHGHVERMPVVRQVASLEMQWCLDCHRNRERQSQAARFRKVSTGLDTGPPSERRLTDCSTCHR
jgi:hypothetical protein